MICAIPGALPTRLPAAQSRRLSLIRERWIPSPHSRLVAEGVAGARRGPCIMNASPSLPGMLTGLPDHWRHRLLARPFLRSVIGRHEQVVGEDDGAVDEFRAVDGFELPYGVRGTVRPVRGLIGELEEVDEFGRVVFLLPGGIHPAPRARSLRT